MQRVRGFLITLIILAIAVHFVWIAVAPLLPEAIVGLAVLSLFGVIYYRKRRW